MPFLLMLQNADINEFRKEWLAVARTSLVFSYFDHISFSKGKFMPDLLEKVRNIRPLHNKLQLSTGHLTNSLLKSFILSSTKRSNISRNQTRTIQIKASSHWKNTLPQEVEIHKICVTHAMTRILQITNVLYAKGVEWFLLL